MYAPQGGLLTKSLVLGVRPGRASISVYLCLALFVFLFARREFFIRVQGWAGKYGVAERRDAFGA